MFKKAFNNDSMDDTSNLTTNNVIHVMEGFQQAEHGLIACGQQFIESNATDAISKCVRKVSSRIEYLDHSCLVEGAVHRICLLITTNYVHRIFPAITKPRTPLKGEVQIVDKIKANATVMFFPKKDSV